MYAPVCQWLEGLLTARHKRSEIECHDTSNIALYRWIEQQGLQHLFPEYLAYDIRVDVTGVAHSKKSAKLAFVECKTGSISLKDISQLLGYCRVARPEFAWIVSPKGISSHVSYLLNTYHRYDVLHYNDQNRIKVATWNQDQCGIDASSVLPPGDYGF